MKLLVKVFIMVHHHGLDYIFVFFKRKSSIFEEVQCIYIFFYFQNHRPNHFHCDHNLKKYF
jgi:hypothetical protein